MLRDHFYTIPNSGLTQVRQYFNGHTGSPDYFNGTGNGGDSYIRRLIHVALDEKPYKKFKSYQYNYSCTLTKETYPSITYHFTWLTNMHLNHSILWLVETLLVEELSLTKQINVNQIACSTTFKCQQDGTISSIVAKALIVNLVRYPKMDQLFSHIHRLTNTYEHASHTNEDDE